MRLDYIREFVELSKSLNFLETAKRLNMTQPALSNHIKVLEDELGVTLLDRKKGSAPRLTKAGRLFLSEIDKIVGRYDHLVAQCRQLAEAEGETLAITLPFFMRESNQILISEVERFKALHPEVEVVLMQGSYLNNPLQDLADGQTDCCLSIIRPPSVVPEALESVALYAEEGLLWADAATVFPESDAVPREALAQYEIVSAASEKSRLSMEWLNDCLEHEVELRFTSHYSESFDDFILNSKAADEVVIVPESYRSYPAFGLRPDRVFKPISPSVQIRIGFYFRQHEEKPAARKFKEFMLGEAADAARSL